MGSLATVANIRQRCQKEGMEAALYDKPRPGRAPKITGDLEAQMTVLACSDPPEGAARGTVRLLADQRVEVGLVESIHYTTVGQRLKKPTQALASKILGHRQAFGPICRQNGGRVGSLARPMTPNVRSSASTKGARNCLTIAARPSRCSPTRASEQDIPFAKTTSMYAKEWAVSSWVSLPCSVNKETKFRGILILVPNIRLIQTWIDEVTKHTQGLEVITHSASGKLSNMQISRNSLIITTMGRIRDHPIDNFWTLLIIDECLSVQNKEYCPSDGGSMETINNVLLWYYSPQCNFFKSRFDKMLYMLKMLNVNLPYTREYLDTILNETITCNIIENDRKWIVNTNKHKLDDDISDGYYAIAKMNLDPEKLYIKLNKYLYDNVDYIRVFEKTINTLMQKRPK